LIKIILLLEMLLKGIPIAKTLGKVVVLSKSTSSSYPILVPFPIFRENFMKNIKKPPTADTLYLDEGVGNE
jgi:hypothetical protein